MCVCVDIILSTLRGYKMVTKIITAESLEKSMCATIIIVINGDGGRLLGGHRIVEGKAKKKEKPGKCSIKKLFIHCNGQFSWEVGG